MTTAKKKLPKGIRRLPSGRYQVRINNETFGTYASLTDAKDAQAVEKGQRAAGLRTVSGGPRTPFPEWVEQWQRLCRTPLSRSRQSFLRAHVLPEFGQQRLGDITPVQVQTWVNRLVDKQLAPSSVAAVYALLRQILNAAVDYDHLVKTPCRAIRLPVRQRSQPTPLTAADVAAIEATIRPKYAAMVHLSAWTGLRWQEAAALDWRHIDLAAATIDVVQAVKATGEIGVPKNGKPRQIHLSPATVAVLQRHRRDFGTAGLLFATRTGTPKAYRDIRRDVWVPCVTALKLDPAPTYHDLRHFFASVVVQGGVDAVALSQAMGHHNPSFTLNTYGYPTADAGQRVTAAISQAQAGGAGTPGGTDN